MPPEDRERIEEIRARIQRNHYTPEEELEADEAWLLDLVERQEAAYFALLPLLVEAARVIEARIETWTGPEADEDAISVYGELHEVLGRDAEGAAS